MTSNQLPADADDPRHARSGRRSASCCVRNGAHHLRRPRRAVVEHACRGRRPGQGHRPGQERRCDGADRREGRQPSRYKTLSISAGARIESLTEADLFAEIQLDEARLVVKAGEGDSFLRTILPEDGITADFDLAPGISLRQGFYFRGSARLEVNVPAHRTFGPIELDSVTIAVGQSEGEDGIPINLGATISAKLGPLTAIVDNVGLTARFSFPATTAATSARSMSTSASSRRTASACRSTAAASRAAGSCGSSRSAARYSGMLELRVPGSVHAQGDRAARRRGCPNGAARASRCSSSSAPSSRRSSSGFGFTLNGVGGLLGLNRTVERRSAGHAACATRRSPASCSPPTSSPTPIGS